MVSDLLRQWAAAEREAVMAEDALRSATKGQMQQSPEILELGRRARELREKADALFHSIYGQVKDLEKPDKGS